MNNQYNKIIFSITVIIFSAFGPYDISGFPGADKDKKGKQDIKEGNASEKKPAGDSVYDKALIGIWKCEGKNSFTMKFGSDGYYYENRIKMSPYKIERDIINIYGFKYQILDLDGINFKWKRVGTKAIVPCTRISE